MTKFCPSSIFKCYIVNHTNRCLDNEIHTRPVTTIPRVMLTQEESSEHSKRTSSGPESFLHRLNLRKTLENGSRTITMITLTFP